MSKKTFVYKTFEDFENRVQEVGLERAYEEGLRQSGRTSRMIIRAVQDYFNTDTEIFVFVADNHLMAQMIAKKFKSVLRNLGVNEDVNVFCFKEREISNSGDYSNFIRGVSNAKVYLDHTCRNTRVTKFCRCK